MSVFITAIGARSPVGLDAEQTATGIRASHLAPRRTRFEHERGGERVAMSMLRALHDDLEGVERMVALAVPALRECATSLGGRHAIGPIPVLLACPAPRPGFAAEDARDLLSRVTQGAGFAACRERSTAFATGHAGLAVALDRAVRLLAASERGPVLVGAVDSFHDAAAVRHLDQAWRILSPSTPDGFIPSEGAAFLAVQRADAPPAGALAEIVLAATALERAVVEGRPNLGLAATEILERATRGLGDGPLRWLLRTTNRERTRAREDRFVTTRLADRIDDGTRMDELAEHLGDAGAASGGLLAVLVCHAFAAGWAPAREAVLALASDGPERGVVALRTVAAGPESAW